MERKKTGRPSKGDRGPLSVLVPTPLLAAARRHAQERGMTLTDLTCELLAAETGTPYTTQEGLPLHQAS